MNTTVVILAGGSGKRFSEISGTTPKQFFSLDGISTFFEETYKRAELITKKANIFCVLPENYIHFVKKIIPDFPDNNLIIEPSRRNTAPCMALSCHTLLDRGFDNPVLFLPSDHFIDGKHEFVSAVKTALSKAEERKLVLIGIKPNRPETGYGYILSGRNERVTFTEKPEKNTARELIDKGAYWNSGMLAVLPSVFIREITKHQPEFTFPLSDYNALPFISTDKAVTEKSGVVDFVCGNFLWDDVGTPESLDRIAPPDLNGNRVFGNAELINCRKCTVVSPDKKVLLRDRNNIFAVFTEDSECIIPKEDKK